MSEISEHLDQARERLKADAPPSPYLTVPEVAALARCEHKSVRHAVHSGRLPAFRTVERILVREADAIAWIESCPARGTASAPRRRQPKRRRPATNGSIPSVRDLDPELRR